MFLLTISSLTTALSADYFNALADAIDLCISYFEIILQQWIWNEEFEIMNVEGNRMSPTNQRKRDSLREVNTNGFLSSVRLLGKTRFSSRRGFLLRQRLRQRQRLFWREGRSFFWEVRSAFLKRYDRIWLVVSIAPPTP